MTSKIYFSLTARKVQKSVAIDEVPDLGCVSIRTVNDNLFCRIDSSSCLILVILRQLGSVALSRTILLSFHLALLGFW